MKKTHKLATLLFPVLLGQAATGQLLITQYYEGSSNNKFLELTNTGGTEIDLSTYTVTRWSNAGSEDWKSATSAGSSETLSGTLAAGESFVIANGSAAIPITAGEADITSSLITFNGNDSVALYEGLDGADLPIIDPANLVDAISITDAGNEGKDLSLVRKTTGTGYDLNIGSTFLGYPSVWEVVTLESVNSAVLGEDLFIGSSAFGTSTPIVSFSGGSAVVNEDGTSVTLSVQILNPGPDAVSVDVGFDSGSSTASLADIGNYSAQTITFPAGSNNGDSQDVTVTLTDDGDSEPSENAIFVLENLQTAGDAAIGGNEEFTVTIVDDDTDIPQIYISEIADPSDDFNARFVEIHNPTDSEIDLGAGTWTLIVYFNANTSGAEIALTGVIPAGGLYVVARDAEVYAGSYPTAPAPNQIDTSINSNGNDNFELRFGGGRLAGTLVDVYGVPGTDGEGTEYFFADSQVTRGIAGPNAVFTIAEWVITSDAGVSMMSPGVLGDVDPPVPSELTIQDVTIDRATGAGSVTATGLGVKIYVVESSTDLGQSDAWAPLANPAAEVDNPDGSVSFNFTDPEAVGAGKVFYRLAEAP